MNKILISSILLFTLAYSHGGRTNSDGCHNQRGGSYHCHGKKSKKTSKQKSTSSHTGRYDCSRKSCKEMSSCKEARYKLSVCYHYSLDRDNDSVPCENICPGG